MAYVSIVPVWVVERDFLQHHGYDGQGDQLQQGGDTEAELATPQLVQDVVNNAVRQADKHVVETETI